MITIIVQYRAYFGKTKDVKEIVNEFVEKVKMNEKGTVSYEVYQDKKDDHLFFHVIKFKDKKGELAHKKSEYVKDFSDKLYPFCQNEPKFYDLKEVD